MAYNVYMLFSRIIRKIKTSGKIKREGEIFPDEIFLDSKNLPQFDVHHLEGRIEKPVGRRVFLAIGAFFTLIGIVFLGKLWTLQVAQGEVYGEISSNNHLRHTVIFADRGVIYDRNKEELAWNIISEEDEDFSFRDYATTSGVAHVLGYLSYPSKDKFGFYYAEEYTGKDGVELSYNDVLSGVNGIKITETDALGNIISENLIKPPEDGDNLTLSIDKGVSDRLGRAIQTTAEEFGFQGGGGVIMDVHTGEILALSSFPEFDPQVMANGEDQELISQYLTDEGKPFLNRVISGVYTPGSIVKPFMAIAALAENIISPEKEILSTGALIVPNPYFPDQPTIFRDWKAHGYTDMREAIAVSSDVYFYTIGGGFGEQRGLGISNIDKYMEMFKIGKPTGINLSGEEEGLIPTPEWKEKTFNGDIWRVGDTYNTSIGQYGFQVTPIQMVRAVAALANGGTLIKPTVIFGSDTNNERERISVFEPEEYRVVKEGMRMAVTSGTASGLGVPGLSVAGKTGTAELGVSKLQVNSWVVGFFPYEEPKYAFAVVMERGSRYNTVGATYVMRQLLDWMKIYTPEYLN